MTAKKFVDYLLISIGYLLILVGGVGGVGLFILGRLTLSELVSNPFSEGWRVLDFTIVFFCVGILVIAIFLFFGFKILSIWKKGWSLLAKLTNYSILAIVILGISFYLYQDPTFPPVDPNHQYDLYKEYTGTDRSRAYRYLCTSADNGHPLARYTLGDTFENVKQNYVQAYVWYSLSGIVDEGELQSFVDKNLSTEEYSNAKKILEAWQPGQCEQELGLGPR